MYLMRGWCSEKGLVLSSKTNDSYFNLHSVKSIAILHFLSRLLLVKHMIHMISDNEKSMSRKSGHAGQNVRGE